MNNEILISVIIPIYNGKKFLKQAVESIMNQPCQNNNIEIVLVNDGSTDSSNIICQKLKEKYSNIAYYEKENSGIGATRNFGISKAKGKYLAFLDQDDVWNTDFFDEEIVEALSSDADIFGFSYYRCNKDFTRGRMIKVTNGTIIGGGIASVNSSWNHHSSLLYKREMVIGEKILCPLTRHEDEIFRHKCLYVAKKVVYIDKLMFLYRNNPSSETHRKQGAETLYGPILNSWRELIAWHMVRDMSDDAIIKLCKNMMCIYGIEGVETLYQQGTSEKKIREIVKEFFHEEILKEYKEIGMAQQNYQRLDLYYNFHKKFAIQNRLKGLIKRIFKETLKIEFVYRMYNIKRYPTIIKNN